MRAGRLTASGLSRAEECLGSVILDQFPESGRYASIGSAVDQYVQAAKQGDPASALKAAPAELRPYLAALTIDRIPDGAEYQTAFALNAATGEAIRIPGRAEGYPSGMGNEWIFGTSDIVFRRDRRAVVIDLKWGSYTAGRDPASDLQLGFYGVCAAAVAGADEAEIGFLRAGWDAVLRPESAVLDSFDLAAMRARIVAIWRRAQAAAAVKAAPLRIGDQCTYCPARRGCGAWEPQTAMVIAGDIPRLVAQPAAAPEQLNHRLRALSPEQRGRAYVIADEIEARAKAIKAAVRDDARLAPIPLGNGTELR